MTLPFDCPPARTAARPVKQKETATVNRPTLDNTIARWARAGIVFGARPSARTPALERLLIDTARHAPDSARLFNHVLAWLSQYDAFVARHRLKQLALTELDDAARPVLGLLLDLAIDHGASRTLNTAAKVCGRSDPPRPLFAVHAASSTRRGLAENTASARSRARGLWAPDAAVRDDALRSAAWIVAKNPAFRERAIRKGDLRTTILETLRHDVAGGRLDSERELVERCGANRPAVGASLNDLALEGVDLRTPHPADGRRTQIVLPGPDATQTTP